MMTRIFGQALKGHAIHYAAKITPEGYGVAACDFKTPIKVNPNATVAEVTCAKCKRYKDYRDWAAEAQQRPETVLLSDPPLPPESPVENAPVTASEAAQAVQKPKPKPKAKPNKKGSRKTATAKGSKPSKSQAEAPAPSDTGAVTASEAAQAAQKSGPDPALTKPKRNGAKAPKAAKPEKAPPPVEEEPEGPVEKEDNRPLKEEDYKTFLESKKTETHLREEALKRANEIGHYEAKFRGGNCLISHVPSRNHMFTIPRCINPAIAMNVVESLNSLSIKWDGQGALPRDFVPAAVTAFKAACKANGIEIKLAAKEASKVVEETRAAEKKAARKIKRRETKPTRKIRRRVEKTEATPKAKNEYGFRPNSIRAEIAYCLEKGIRTQLLKIHLREKGFKLSDKQINAKVKGTIRNLLKKGYEFQQLLSKDETRCSVYIVSTPTEKMPI